MCFAEGVGGIKESDPSLVEISGPQNKSIDGESTSVRPLLEVSLLNARTSCTHAQGTKPFSVFPSTRRHKHHPSGYSWMSRRVSSCEMSNSSSRDGLKVCTTTTSLGSADLLLPLASQDDVGLAQMVDVSRIEFSENLFGSMGDVGGLVLELGDERPEARDFTGRVGKYSFLALRCRGFSSFTTAIFRVVQKEHGSARKRRVPSWRSVTCLLDNKVLFSDHARMVRN